MAVIDYFYSAHSAFAYIGSRRLLEICARHGCTLVHKPIALRTVIDAAGGYYTGARTPARRAYFFGREIERWAEYRGAPIITWRPTHHDAPLDLSNGMLIAAIEQGANVGALSHALLEGHWRDDIDLSDPVAVARTARAAGIDPEPLLEAALSEAVQAVHRANTQEAIDRGVFGSPTYFVDGDMFYGQDHLELVARALVRPFAAPAYGKASG